MDIRTSRRTAGLTTAQKSRVNAAQTSNEPPKPFSPNRWGRAILIAPWTTSKPRDDEPACDAQRIWVIEPKSRRSGQDDRPARRYRVARISGKGRRHSMLCPYFVLVKCLRRWSGRTAPGLEKSLDAAR